MVLKVRTTNLIPKWSVALAAFVLYNMYETNTLRVWFLLFH